MLRKSEKAVKKIAAQFYPTKKPGLLMTKPMTAHRARTIYRAMRNMGFQQIGLTEPDFSAKRYVWGVVITEKEIVCSSYMDIREDGPAVGMVRNEKA